MGVYEDHIKKMMQHPVDEHPVDDGYKYISHTGNCRFCGEYLYNCRHNGCEVNIDRMGARLSKSGIKLEE